MVSQDRKVKVIIAILALWVFSVQSIYALTPAEDLISNIKLINHKGEKIMSMEPLLRPLIPSDDLEGEAGRPATWGDFVYQVGEKFGKNVEFILKYNRSRKELIITKDEIADSFRLLLEEVNKVKANVTGKYRIRAMIDGITNKRNYLNITELSSILQAEVRLTSTGDLTERMIVKIADVQGDIIKVNRILNDVSSEERLISALKVPWKNEHKIYAMDVVGNKIISIEPVADISYGIVTQKGDQLFVKDSELTALKSPKVGNFIEYAINEGKASMVNNFGKYSDTYLVKSVNSTGITTYEGVILAKTLKVVDGEGIEVGQNNLKQGDVIAKFGDHLIVGGGKSDHSVKYYNDKIYIDNVGYSAKGLKVSNGVKTQDVLEFKYLDKISKASITWDVLGNPKKVEVERVEFVTYIQEVKDKVLIGSYTGGTLPVDLEWDKVTTPIQAGLVYRMVIIDKKIVEAVRVNASTGYLNRIYGDYIYVGSKIINVTPTTATLSRTTSTAGLPTTDYAIKTYESVLADIGKNNSNYLWVGVYSLDGINADLLTIHQIGTTGPTGTSPDNTHRDYLSQTPLNIYKVNAFGWGVSGEGTITLSDSTNTSTFKVPNSYMFAGLNYGDYITLHMSVHGVIDWMAKFEYTHQNIKTAGLARYLGLPGNIVNVESVTLGSVKAIALRTENIVYEITGEIITEVPITTPLTVGKTYIIIKNGQLVKILVEGGV